MHFVIQQDELEKHIDEHIQIQVFTYYGQSRTSNIKQLAENDVVLTTYQTLASDSKVCLITASSPRFTDSLRLLGCHR